MTTEMRKSRIVTTVKVTKNKIYINMKSNQMDFQFYPHKVWPERKRVANQLSFSVSKTGIHIR